MPDQIQDLLRIAVAQLNPTVGDVSGNLEKARVARARAAAEGAHLLMLTELFIAGYPPEDLVLKPAFQRACREAVESFAAETADGGPGVLIGAPWRDGDKLHNAYALLDNGRVEAVRYKVDLPNYGVFDEKRVFQPGPYPGPVAFRGVRLGVPICEDIWSEDVVETLCETGSEILLVPNGSPWWIGKHEQRLNIAVRHVVDCGLPLVYANQICGQDELVFDGGSFGLNADRTLAFQLPSFDEGLAVTEWRRDGETWHCADGPKAALEDGDEAIWLACVLGLRDYVNKNRFPGVVLGLSGGIDSAVCAAMAVDALGPERVRCIMLPYRYTSNASISDAADCAERLGVRYETVPIAPAVDGLLETLGPLFDGLPPDITEENLQSRARGTLLMAVSNKFGPMVVTTGNKSEVSVGYATLYGDMNGGFNPIKDLYKVQVYALARWRNENRPKHCLGPTGPVIPESIITKAPTAELRENQKDQ
ncbi:MAG: NAD+ synthase, partial [Pseudomonadota bacterium]|nr:NAD+ synthase [Pseudomonadota bacterium]